MAQSNAIFGALLVAYIVFITVRGELPDYITILRGGGPQASGAGGSSGGSSNPLAGGITSLENAAASLLASDPGIAINAPAP